MKQNRSVLPLLLVLLLALMAVGCNRNHSDPPNPSADKSISLELAGEEQTSSDSTEQEETPASDEQPTTPAPEQSQPESTPSQEQQETKETPVNSEKTKETPVNSEQAKETPSSSPLPADFPKELQTLPAEQLKNNPNHLDTRLYAVFQNVMEQKRHPHRLPPECRRD